MSDGKDAIFIEGLGVQRRMTIPDMPEHLAYYVMSTHAVSREAAEDIWTKTYIELFKHTAERVVPSDEQDQE